jgi:hypothetical protein
MGNNICLDDFLIKGQSSVSGIGRLFDYQKIVKLPDKDFAGFYLALMTEYRDKEGWWSEGKIPKCGRCSKEISGPAQLRRYYGRSLDPDCFVIEYQKDSYKDDSRLMRQFWERVAKLRIE